MEKIMTGRPQRIRRHSRRAWPPEDDIHQPRLVKRLFTPDIKRMLKDWLVRRRENPYPSRDEKKRLAVETGLTYTQICNWFANWRRKLKNSERERSQRSWGHLIKNYNTNARGNVEQFSISSEDSIWEENELERADVDDLKRSDDDDDDGDGEYESREDGMNSSTEGTVSSSNGYASYGKCVPKINGLMRNQLCFKRNIGIPIFSSTPLSFSMPYEDNKNAQELPRSDTKQIVELQNAAFGNAKYKQKMMQKYLRDTNDAHLNVITQQAVTNMSATADFGTQQLENCSAGVGGVENMRRSDNTALTKWLESAARFTPDKNNYFIEWNGRTGKLQRKPNSKQMRCFTIIPANSSIVQRQSTNSCPTQLELDAAEALANMAFNCRQRMLDSNNNSASGSLQTVNAISS